MSNIIGIDLGTTNSAVAIVEDGRPVIIPDENGNRILPSVVGLSPSGELLVGIPAKNQFVVEPENTVRSIKRKMGSMEKVRMGDREYLPQEISAIIVRRLKQIAERYLGTEVTQAVITVPAYFSDAQRQATKDAGEIAGLEVLRIINEPTAAALAYGLEKEEDQFVLVYDLGGGTFDVSVVEMNSGVVEVRASHGNTHLGGDDFDQRIVDHLAEEFREAHGVDLREDRRSLARLLRASEDAKIRLSNHAYTHIKEEYITKKGLLRSLHLDRELGRHEMEEWIEDLVRSTTESIDVAMKDAGLEPEQLDKILLVGGSTRMPLVVRTVEERLKREPHAEINPDEAVALGAAVQGAIIAGEEIDTVLVDVTPYSLGVETATIRHGTLVEDLYSVIIRRNTAIPVSRTERYWTLYPGQESVHIKVYQGESRIASKNTLLGEFLFSGLPKHEDQLTEILVNFDCDVNGIVNVTATCKETGQQDSIQVTTSRARLSAEQIETAREALVAAEAAGKGDYAEHQALLSQARELLPRIEDAETRQELEEVIGDLAEAIRDDDQDAADAARDDLINLMYELEEGDEGQPEGVPPSEEA
jgi:molecular chaperone DnaK